jgi:hypothetical protein
MHTRSLARLLPVAAVAALAACGSDGPSAPQSRSSLDQAFLELNSLALGPGMVKPTSVPALVPSIGDGSRCTYTTSSQSFACPNQTLGDLVFGSSFTLLGASGTPQSAFDASSTAAVRFDATLTGTAIEGPTRLAIDVKQSLTLSGLLTGPRVIDGTGTSTIAGNVTPASTPIPFTTTTTTTITRLVLPSGNQPGGWPLSGTITSQSSTSVSGLPAVPSRVVVTFSGSSRVALEVTVAGATKRCNVDLATQALACG